MASLTTSYYTVKGEIIGESTGGVRVDYQVDALGSVTGHIDQTGVSINKARYKPYGGLLSGTQYTVGRCGTLGYRTKSTLKSADVYVRARSYGTKIGQWATRDPLWPNEISFGYSDANPSTKSDQSGLAPKSFCDCRHKPPHAVNVPCPGCVTFRPPDTGWPIGRKPSGGTRQSCFDRACRVYCSSGRPYADVCPPWRVDCCVLVNYTFKPCDRTNPNHKECIDESCNYDGGTSGNASCGQGQLGGHMCCVEALLRVCCYNADIVADNRRRESDLQRDFAFCSDQYKVRL